MKKNVDILAPAMILEYNPSMSTIDIADHVFPCNCPGIRSKKWWFPLLTFYLQSSLCNSYLIYQETPGAGTVYLDSLHPVVQTYFFHMVSLPKSQGNKCSMATREWKKRISETTRMTRLLTLPIILKNVKMCFLQLTK